MDTMLDSGPASLVYTVARIHENGSRVTGTGRILPAQDVGQPRTGG
jgi:hypothetical protein